jgi:hypothetical protein
MSFSSQVKSELIKIEYENSCCKKSLLYGMALFDKSFSSGEIFFQTENKSVATLYQSLLKELCNIETKLVISPSGKNFTVENQNRADATKLLSFFGHSNNETGIRINVSNFVCNHCQNAFFAGAFLSCGTVSSPEKGYHLEFTVAFHNLSKSLVTVLQEAELNPKFTVRNGYNIIYFKDSEAIEDCLYIMGASSAMFDMMNIKIVKEIRNSANRKANCETANIEKMVKAASPQIEAIEKIKKQKGLDFLSPQLQEMAEIRLENPDSSLAELAQLFDPPLSKSGVNHRLKKIISIANEL